MKKKCFVIVWKHKPNEILEAYDDFDMADVFLSKQGARKYLKRYFTKNAWPNYSRDIKVVPCVINFTI
jgi:hypothetical protein